MDELMIKVENIAKEYQLGAIGGTTLRDELQRRRAKRKKQDDPTLKIGQKQVNIGERFMALNGVSFEVKKGEAVGIIGHNGAGKSTLLKLITRITAPTSGDIYLNGRVASMLEVGTGFHPELTGRENVYLNGAILGMTKKEIDAKMDDIIEFSEVRQFIDTPVKRYSSGMYVKLAFSVAAHLDSEILIMDEVLAVGDMAFQNKCLKKMRSVAKNEGRTVLYVSHNMNTIRTLCDRCIVLDHGRIIYDGDVDGAIITYLNQPSDLRVNYDYTNSPRDGRKNYRVQLLGLNIEDRTASRYHRGEPLSCTLHCKANADVHNIGFRMEFFCADGSVVGAALSDSKISAAKNQLLDVHLQVDTRNFPEGRYYAIILAYEEDGDGHQLDTDRVEPGLFFEITPNESDHISWLHRYWGHTRFPDMLICNKP